MEQALTNDQIEMLLVVSTAAMAVLSTSVVITVLILNYKIRKDEKCSNYSNASD